MTGTPEQGGALTVAGDPTNATINQLIQVLQRRKLLWEFKTGIVVPFGSSLGQVIVTVQLDGDDNPIPCKTLIGPVPVGMRVGVIFVPPTGYYVIGFIGGNTPYPLGLVAGVNVVTIGALSAAASAETNVPNLQFSASINTSRLYEFRVQVQLVGTVANDAYNLNLRRDATLTGTQLATGTGGGAANAPTPFFTWPIIPTTNETINFFVSFSRRNGTGTFQAFGAPNVGIARTWAGLFDVGPAGMLLSA